MSIWGPIRALQESRHGGSQRWKQSGKKDFPALDGTVFVMPFETNLAWTHEVPASAKRQGRRIVGHAESRRGVHVIHVLAADGIGVSLHADDAVGLHR